MAIIAYSFSTSAVNPLCSLRETPPRPSLRPSCISSRNPSKINTFRSGRLSISCGQSSTLRVLVRAKLVSDDDLELSPELESPSSSDAPSQSGAATIDLKLPRRSLLVQFTCNECSERTQRLVNRLAYEKGTVFVQCAGCLQHHKLVDNLGLVVEYDLREEAGLNMEDQVLPESSC